MIENMKDLALVKKSVFELYSGKLLIADPFYLGYSDKITDALNRARCTSRPKNSPCTFFKNGLLYTTLVPSDDGREVAKDCAVSVFARGKNGLDLIIDSDRKKPLLEASVDVCCLLVGDADIFSVPAEKISNDSPDRLCVLSHGEKPSEADFKSSRDFWSKLYQEQNAQTISMPKGIYEIKHNLQKKLLTLKKQ